VQVIAHITFSFKQWGWNFSNSCGFIFWQKNSTRAGLCRVRHCFRKNQSI